jgi:hypothetical protein
MENTKSNKYEIVFACILLITGYILFFSGLKLQEIAPYADTYYKAYLFLLALYILNAIDKPILKGAFPIGKIPEVSSSFNVLLLVAGICGIILLGLEISNTFSMVQLFSIETTTLSLSFLGLFFFGYIVPNIEEPIWGRFGVPMVEQLIAQFSLFKGFENPIARLVNAFTFGLFHIVVTQISFGMATVAFLFRIVIDELDVRYGAFIGDLIHSLANSFVFGVVLMKWSILSFWFFPTVLIIVPYLFAGRAKAL